MSELDSEARPLLRAAPTILHTRLGASLFGRAALTILHTRLGASLFGRAALTILHTRPRHTSMTEAGLCGLDTCMKVPEEVSNHMHHGSSKYTYGLSHPANWASRSVMSIFF